MVNDLEYKRIESKRYYNIFKKVHHCNKCSYFSRSIFLMLNHVQRHKREEKKFSCSEGVEAFFCTQCQFRTFLTVKFIQHVKKYHSHTSEEKPFPVKYYKCKKCSFETRSILIWYNHRKNRCSVNKKKCKKRNLYGNLSYEIKTRKTSKRGKSVIHKCERCSFSSKYAEVLRLHYKQHLSKSQWLGCDQCGYKSNSHYNLVRHLTRVHTKQFVKCSYCDYKSRRVDNLAIHIKNVHKTEKIGQTSVTNNRKSKKIDSEAVEVQDNEPKTSINQPNLKLERKFNENFSLVKEEKETVRGTYKCDGCPLRSKYPQLARAHSKLHISKSKWLECEQCDYKTTITNNLLMHYLRVHRKKSKVNKNEQNNEEPTKTVSKKASIVPQTKSIDGNKTFEIFGKGSFVKYVCDHCPYMSKYLKVVRVHSQLHTSKSGFLQCEDCDYKTKTNYLYLKHYSRKHKNSNPENTNSQHPVKKPKSAPETQPKWFKCDQCLFRTSYPQLMKIHHIKHSSQLPKWFGCDQCGYKTDNIDYYVNHSRLHFKRSIEKPEINQSVNSVKSKKPKRNKIKNEWFDCEHCSYKTQIKKRIKLHFDRSHREDNWLKCDHCEYKSRRSDKMKEHVAVHIPAGDRKRYCCEYCDYKTVYLRYLRKHVQKIHS